MPSGAATQCVTVLLLQPELELDWAAPRGHDFLVLPKDRTLLLPIRSGNCPRKGFYWPQKIHSHYFRCVLLID